MHHPSFHQSPFHDDHTSPSQAYSQSSFPASSAPRAPRMFTRLWQRYRRASRPLQLGCACLLLLMLCAICSGTSSLIAGPGQNEQARAIPSPTPTAMTHLTTPVPTGPFLQADTHPTPSPTLAGTTPTPLPALATPTPRPQLPRATPTPTPVPHPTPRPTVAPTPTPRPTGVNGNPWGFTFEPGTLIYNPPGAFCSYFSCITNFWKGVGYVIECHDGMYSKSGGRSGSCSYHGGNWRPLYAH